MPHFRAESLVSDFCPMASIARKWEDLPAQVDQFTDDLADYYRTWGWQDGQIELPRNYYLQPGVGPNGAARLWRASSDGSFVLVGGQFGEDGRSVEQQAFDQWCHLFGLIQDIKSDWLDEVGNHLLGEDYFGEGDSFKQRSIQLIASDY